MYILASDIFEKDDIYVFKARNSCCVQGNFTFNTYYVFFDSNQIIIDICTSEILKTRI